MWDGLRFGMGSGIALLVAAPIWVGLCGLGLAGPAAAIATGVICAVLVVLIAPRLPVVTAKPIVVFAVAAATLAGAFMLIRIAPFMADPVRQDASFVTDGFFEQHNCLTAYVRAAEVDARGEPNLYDIVHYFGDHDDDPRAQISVFAVDPFEYPPTFVAPVRAVIAITDDFATIRALWFSVEALLVAAGLVALARWIGGREGLVVGAWSPLLLGAVPVVATLQVGNFQVAVYALAIFALIAFDRGRHALGGVLLAIAILSKLFPGVFVIVLIARRQWRALAWTVGSAIVLSLVAVAVVGIQPFHAFVTYQLPRMADGSAFPWLADLPPAVAVNHSIFGIIYKLHDLGVAGMTPGVAGAVAWVYTLALLAYVWVSARRPRPDRFAEALWWLVLLQLGALRSPFCPDVFALIIPSWLAVLLALQARLILRIVLGLLWVGFAAAIIELGVPTEMSDGMRFALTGAAQLGGFFVVGLAMRRAYQATVPSSSRTNDATTSASRTG
ncbi:MAG: glycosyltransferase family 87 protein [Deltaproteobacteria bacterium]